MNTEKVFTAFNKEGKEILLYRKDRDTYIDLLSDKNEIYNKDNIELNTLVNANKSLNLKKHMLAAIIKRRYNKDRSKVINTKNILFGQELTITDLKETKIDSGWRRRGRIIYDYKYDWKNEESEYMNIFEFKRQVEINDYTYNVYLNLYNKEEYIVFNNTVKNICKLPTFGEGMKFIRTVGFTLNDAIKESVLEKKKVYEYSYETSKFKIEK